MRLDLPGFDKHRVNTPGQIIAHTFTRRGTILPTRAATDSVKLKPFKSSLRHRSRQNQQRLEPPGNPGPISWSEEQTTAREGREACGEVDS